MRDQARRADEQPQRRGGLDGGDLLVPLVVVRPADIGLEDGETVDLRREHDERAQPDHRAARRRRAPPQKNAAEQKYQRDDDPGDDTRVADHGCLLPEFGVRVVIIPAGYSPPSRPSPIDRAPPARTARTPPAYSAPA